MRVDLVDMTSEYIPLALLYLKSYAETDPLIGEHYRITVFAPADPKNLDGTCREIVARRPDVVGFSCYIWNMLDTMELCRRLRAALPDLFIVVGGPDVSSVPWKALDNYPWIDIVVRGEGEETFRELLHLWGEHGSPFRGQRLQNIKGLAYRTDDGIALTERRPFLENLDLIPSPYLNGCLDLATEKRTILFETYRGCPFKCSFCFYPKDYGNLLHHFSLPRVEHDLRQVLASGVESIYLMDPTFNVPPKRAKEILRIIAANRRSDALSVTVELRVDLLDAELMLLLKNAGISVVEVGLQSANESVLRAVDRKQNMKKIAKNVAYLQSIGINVVFQLIYGMPEETYESFLDSLDFCVGLRAQKIEAYRLQLLPGTPMYNEASLLGLQFPDHGDRKVVATRTMTKQDIEKAEHLADLVECFYDDGVARDSFRWLAAHIGLTYARLIDKYAAWRLAIAQSFTTWRTEEGTYLEQFVSGLDLPDGGEVVNVVRNLKRYDYYGSLVLALKQPTLVAFDYDIDALLAANGRLLHRQNTWLLFEQSEQIGRNLFNGKFIDKPYRVIPKSFVFKKVRTLDFDFRDGEYAAIARWHLAYGDRELAKTIARRLLERDRTTYEASHLLGVVALEDGQLVQAIKLLQHAAKLRPDLADSYLTLASAFFALGKVDDGIGALMTALAIDPSSVEAHYNLGVALAELGKFDTSMASFRSVIERRPHFAPAFYGLGDCLNQSGRLGEAVSCYERALELWPEYEDARIALTAIRRTLARIPSVTSPGS